MAILVSDEKSIPTNVMLSYYFTRRVETSKCTFDNLTNTATVPECGQIMKSNICIDNQDL